MHQFCSATLSRQTEELQIGAGHEDEYAKIATFPLLSRLVPLLMYIRQLVSKHPTNAPRSG